MESDVSTEFEGQKIRLRRLNVNRRLTPSTSPLSEKIQKNLEPLKQNNKKVIAQTLFYQQNPQGMSPMVRSNKPPVRQRLGNRIQLRRWTYTGTSTLSVPPKARRQAKQTRMYSAQMRLNRIRQSHQTGYVVTTPASMKKSIRLRRTLPNNIFANQPTNLMVQVKNTNYQEHIHQRSKRFKMYLNPIVQAQIRDLQQQHVSNPMLLDELVVPVRSTDLTLHARFASY